MLKGAGDIWTEKSKLINGIKQQLMALIIIYGTKEKVNLSLDFIWASDNCV